jgi:glycerol uptake facilitator-like aquaporin
MFVRQSLAEALGTALLVCAVVGSGIMAENLSGGNVGLALLANAIATGAALYVLITVFGPLSGAQFNPIVSVWLGLTAQQPVMKTTYYIVAQIIGGCLGAVLANAMFDLDILQVSNKLRGGYGVLLGEVVASFGLIFMLSSVLKFQPQNVASSVALYITAAYWFTSSTSFANPAVSIARMFSNSFAGIAPASVLPFVLAQFAGMALAILAWRVLRDES